MKAIAIQTVKNMQRHFCVWGLLATVIMYAGIQENQSRTGHFDREPAAGTYAHVLENNKCADTVEGQFPTAIIGYNLHTGGYFYSEKPADISNALDEQFADKDWHGFDVRHFCK
jgi:hypothetical protein